MDERPAEGADDTEAAWREIIANYGERPSVEEYDGQATYDLGGGGAPVGDLHPRHDDRYDEDDYDDLDDEDDPFVPPPAPPLPAVRPERLAAWLGVLGSPTVLLVLLLAGITAPTWLGWTLIGAFVGGFGYLVATMPREPRDPWDDGARL